MKLLRFPGRFEWKILAALFIVASVPLATAAYLMSVTIGRIQAITEQHQEAVRKSLGGAVDVYKSYFGEMKETFRDRATEIASTPVAHAADLGRRPRAAPGPDPRRLACDRRVVRAPGGARKGRTKPRRRWSRSPRASGRSAPSRACSS